MKVSNVTFNILKLDVKKCLFYFIVFIFASSDDNRKEKPLLHNSKAVEEVMQDSAETSRAIWPFKTLIFIFRNKKSFMLLLLQLLLITTTITTTTTIILIWSIKEKEKRISRRFLYKTVIDVLLITDTYDKVKFNKGKILYSKTVTTAGRSRVPFEATLTACKAAQGPCLCPSPLGKKGSCGCQFKK